MFCFVQTVDAQPPIEINESPAADDCSWVQNRRGGWLNPILLNLNKKGVWNYNTRRISQTSQKTYLDEIHSSNPFPVQIYSDVFRFNTCWRNMVGCLRNINKRAGACTPSSRVVFSFCSWYKLLFCLNVPFPQPPRVSSPPSFLTFAVCFVYIQGLSFKP